MKTCFGFAFAFLFSFHGLATLAGEPYHLKTAEIRDGELVFASDTDFDEVLRVGFFRIKRPPEINIAATREFAHNFVNNDKYTSFGMIDNFNGFLLSEKSQTVRFELERDHWDKGFSPEVQKVGEQLTDVGITILKAILTKFKLPEDEWFTATAGSSAREGSIYLVFNHYDPKTSGKPYGLKEHVDWGYVAVLDAVEPGLEGRIDGVWRPLVTQDGYLIINFGDPLHRLLPAVHAGWHRVPYQSSRVRTSTVLFIDPWIGNFKDTSSHAGELGMVWDWDATLRQLVNGKSASDYFDEKNRELHGEVSTAVYDY